MKLKNPHLPLYPVTTVVCQQQAAVYLSRLSVGVLSPVPCPFLSPEINEHADMLFCHLGNDNCLIAPGQEELKKNLRQLGFSPVESIPLSSRYPGDIPLNCCITESAVIGNFAFSDSRILSYAKETGKQVIAVKQGYTKCSLCVVDDRAFITEDEGLFRQLTALSFDILKITPGDIELSRQHYGFLGGASGKISENTLAIFGSLNYHRDKEKILCFLEKYGVTPLYLRDTPIKDIGGILPVTEGA